MLRTRVVDREGGIRLVVDASGLFLAVLTGSFVV